MRRTVAALVPLTLALGACGVIGGDDDDEPAFEVWAVDQSGTAGTLYIYDGQALNRDPGSAVPEVIDLSTSVTPLCVARTGSAPTRAHMMMINQDQSHAILAYVATGHVVFFDARSRAPLDCLDVGVQAHAAFPSRDGSYVIAANQNGKLLQRIRTNYAANTFTLEPAATLDLAACTTPGGLPCEAPGLRPDNAPICPVIESRSRLVFTTLRGGGLLVVDATTTPMSIVAEYDQATVRGNGCGGVEQGGKMYVNAGGGTAGNPTEHDLYSFNLLAFPSSGAAAMNTPAPRVVYQLDAGSHDGHGLLVHPTAGGRYLWAADRFSNEILIVDTRSDGLVDRFSLAGDKSADPAPDLIEHSPRGLHAYVSLRGPCPLTANAPAVDNSVGATPGVGVIRVIDDGRRGELVGVAPIRSPSAPFACATVGGTPMLSERADPHALNVRLK